jgi:hypothetical protein
VRFRTGTLLIHRAAALRRPGAYPRHYAPITTWPAHKHIPALGSQSAQGVASDGHCRRRTPCATPFPEGAGWKKWGPYLSERQWGTVREDYSPFGNAKYQQAAYPYGRLRALFRTPVSGPFGPLLRQSLFEPGTFNQRQRDEKWSHNLLQFRPGKVGIAARCICAHAAIFTASILLIAGIRG